MTAQELSDRYPEVAEMAQTIGMPTEMACAVMGDYERLSKQEAGKLFFVLFLVSIGMTQIIPMQGAGGRGQNKA